MGPSVTPPLHTPGDQNTEEVYLFGPQRDPGEREGCPWPQTPEYLSLVQKGGALASPKVPRVKRGRSSSQGERGLAGGPGKDRWTPTHILWAKGPQSSLGPPRRSWLSIPTEVSLPRGPRTPPPNHDLPVWLASSSQARWGRTNKSRLLQGLGPRGM